MKVLHICNDFCGSKVHACLYQRLDELGVEQTVFTYYRGTDKEGRNRYDGQHTTFIYKRILRIWHRVLYHYKIKRVFHELKREINPLEYDVVHATTLFSDGAIAYQINREYGIPYIVAVRNTDINTFLGMAPYTWSMGMKILKHAERIIFISKALQDKFCRHVAIRRLVPEIQDRMLLQPNGVDDYWLEHINPDERPVTHEVIFVGQFNRNKNVIRLIKAVLKLRRDFPDLRLHLVGGGSKDREVRKLECNNPDCLVCHGQIDEKDKLKVLYRRCAIFAMPSIHETFGLAYIEALLQNLKILYTKGQGVDGMFDPYVGEAVIAHSMKSIENGLRKLLSNNSSFQVYNMVDFEQFRWYTIAERYKRIYEEIVRCI